MKIQKIVKNTATAMYIYDLFYMVRLKQHYEEEHNLDVSSSCLL